MSTDFIWLSKLLVDFGLVVLILMVQLIVYPSFKFYDRESLLYWHKLYKTRLAVIVIPLMFAQVILSVIIVWNLSTYAIINGILVVGVWVSTFIQFVPIHNRITNESYKELDLELLVKRNWVRVAIWVAIFSVSLLQYNTI
ncbi:hypothetical protein EAX61_10895 [Dokdonia sinensis]|uniref:DUF1772 domain-containing protein n=1 Tax=Dokdonia sinensis TaxID=2479847 RepID=A0A3M0G7F5_9FLAO|nr:hypothetical protein [Dokdonia sinensis]RMB57613.1 hypothetical protein EAX61_10895 [Dokdonia sinensis]